MSMFRKLQPSKMPCKERNRMGQHTPVTIPGQLRQDGEVKVRPQSIAARHMCDGHQGCVPRCVPMNGLGHQVTSGAPSFLIKAHRLRIEDPQREAWVLLHEEDTAGGTLLQAGHLDGKGWQVVGTVVSFSVATLISKVLIKQVVWREALVKKNAWGCVCASPPSRDRVPESGQGGGIPSAYYLFESYPRIRDKCVLVSGKLARLGRHS